MNQLKMYLPNQEDFFQALTSTIYLFFIFIGYGILKFLKWLFPHVGDLLLKALSQWLEDFVGKIVRKSLEKDLSNIRANIHDIKNYENANICTSQIAIDFMKNYYKSKDDLEKYNELISKSDNVNFQLLLLIENAKK